MSELKKIEEEIEKAQQVLVESRENLNKNPEDFAAKLLLTSIENHLGDLLVKRDRSKSDL